MPQIYVYYEGKSYITRNIRALRGIYIYITRNIWDWGGAPAIAVAPGHHLPHAPNIRILRVKKMYNTRNLRTVGIWDQRGVPAVAVAPGHHLAHALHPHLLHVLHHVLRHPLLQGVGFRV